MAGSNEAVEVSGVAALSGTPKQVRASLSRLNAEQVVALTLEHGSEPAAKALAQAITRFAPLVATILKGRQEKALNAILEALVPEVAPPHEMLVEARMAGEARKAVLESGDWLTAAQVAKAAGFSPTNPSAQPNKWKKDGQIFAIRHRGFDYFPAYALDPAANYRPTKAVARVLAAFKDRKDEWGIAYWFASLNGFLGGKRPQDLILSEPDRVVAAAQDEISGVLHG